MGGFTGIRGLISRRFPMGRKGGQEPARDSPMPCPRVLMQEFHRRAAVVDSAAMRDGIKSLGRDAQKINPLNPVIW